MRDFFEKYMLFRFRHPIATLSCSILRKLKIYILHSYLKSMCQRKSYFWENRRETLLTLFALLYCSTRTMSTYILTACMLQEQNTSFLYYYFCKLLFCSWGPVLRNFTLCTIFGRIPGIEPELLRLQPGVLPLSYTHP